MNISTNLENEIEATVLKAKQAWNIPGLALAVVKDDKVLYMKGYGVRELGKSDPVDVHTIFAAASMSKAFTATAIGLLVQDGKLNWDDPIKKYLPAFQLHDFYVTQLITIRDLLSHRGGLGTYAGDVLLNSSYPPEEVVRRLRYIPPGYSFRAGFGYSSLMYLTATLIVSAVSRMSWDDYIRQRIFEPLGMADSVTNSCYFENRTNIATPHENIAGKLQTVIYRKDARYEGAASICTSISDISLWMRLLLNGGQIDGKQIVEPEIIAETHTPHTPLKLSDIERQLFPSQHFSAYGLGWFLYDLHGRFVAQHLGDVDGMLSNMVLIPEEKIGVAVLTNKKPNNAMKAIPNFIVDKLLEVTPRDWIQTYIDLEKDWLKEEEQAKKQKEESRVIDTHSSLPLEKCAGTYESAILGQAVISIEEGGLQIRLQAHASMCGMLRHWHYDTYLCKWDDPTLGESLIPFISNGQGEVAEFHLRIREEWLDSLEHNFKKIPH